MAYGAITMTRLDYQNAIKDYFGVARTVNDGQITDTIIISAINDALDRVTVDLKLNPSIMRIGRIKNRFQYQLPANTLQVRGVQFKGANNEWSDIDYEIPDNFMDGINEDKTASEPETFTIYGRTSENYRVSTDSAENVNRFAPLLNVTAQSSSTLICYGMNFGLIESGSRVRVDDRIWNNTDDSYGSVDYLDMTTAKTEGVATAGLTATNFSDTESSSNFVTDLVVPGDVILNTTTFAYAFVTEVVDGDNLTYTDVEGTPFAESSPYKVGTADRIVMAKVGGTTRGLLAGTDQLFDFADSGHDETIVTISTSNNSGDTLTANTPGDFDTSLISVGMMVLISGDTSRTAKVLSVTPNVVKVEYWIGGPISGSEAVTFGTGDEWQVESKFRTRETLMIQPASSVDDIGTERLRLMYTPAPTKPDSDLDPIEIDDRLYSQLIACMRYMVAERSASYSISELNALEGLYISRLTSAPIVSTAPTSKHLSVHPSASSRKGSRNATRWSSSNLVTLP